VKLVEERGIRRQVSLEERARVLVAGAVGKQPVDGQHAARVGVGDERGAASGVQQDRVRGLGPEADDPQHLAAEGGQWCPAHAVEAPAEPIEQPARERLESPRLEPIRPGRADDLGQLVFGKRGQALGAEETARAQGADRAGSVHPPGVLGQDRADRHLVRRPRRPPALRPESARERDVETQQPRLDGVRRGPGNLSPAESR
jgi:hypothetical protein